METFITLIAVTVVVGILWYALNRGLTLLPINNVIRTAIEVILLVFLAIFIADLFGLVNFFR